MELCAANDYKTMALHVHAKAVEEWWHGAGLDPMWGARTIYL